MLFLGWMLAGVFFTLWLNASYLWRNYRRAAFEFREACYAWKAVVESYNPKTKGPTIPPFPNPGAKFLH